MDCLKRLKEEIDGLRKKAYDQDAINDAVYNGVKLHKEPVSDGFEEEVRKYAPIYYKDNDISKFARHFANWQKEKDREEVIEWIEDNIEQYPVDNWDRFVNSLITDLKQVMKDGR